MSRSLSLVSCALALGAALRLAAHSVWIEPGEGQLVIRFAEPDGRLEKSPGYLDSLSLPVAFVLVTNAPVLVDAPKKSDHFLLVGTSTTNTACAETSFTVRGGRKPNFYARWQPSGFVMAAPMMTLDLVPTDKAGEVRVYLRGQPLGGVKATLRTPDEKEQELVANAEGFLRFAASQNGQYLLTIAHQREPIAGYHGGRAYKETSHNASLTWRQEQAENHAEHASLWAIRESYPDGPLYLLEVRDARGWVAQRFVS